jgi:hypothetical protein
VSRGLVGALRPGEARFCSRIRHLAPALHSLLPLQSFCPLQQSLARHSAPDPPLANQPQTQAFGGDNQEKSAQLWANHCLEVGPWPWGLGWPGMHTRC